MKKQHESKTRRMASIYLLTCILISIFESISISDAVSTLTPSQNLTDGQTLTSYGDTFMLGFFNTSTSNNRYLGIWYNTIPLQTIVWVANRDAPVTDQSGVLKMRPDGNIVIVNGTTDSVIWSTNSSGALENPILEFLESGNIIVRNEGNRDPENYLWQSFDSPVGTLLPGMRLGWNLTTGAEYSLSAWRSSTDPSHGDFTMRIDINGSLEPVITRGSRKYYRAGPWNGRQFSGAADLRPNSLFTYQLLQNNDEVYFVYHLVDPSVLLRYVLTQTGNDGYLERYTWANSTNSWVRLVSIPRDRCDDYGLCGNYSTCDVTNVQVCLCLEGFRPRSPQDYIASNWAQGCVRNTSLNCTLGDGFRRLPGVKLPDISGSWLDTRLNLEECRVRCLNNCTCMAYSNSDVGGNGSGCIMWFDDLVDIRQMGEDGQDLFVRMAASELARENRGNNTDEEPGNNSESSNKRVLIVTLTVIPAVLLLGLSFFLIWKRKSKNMKIRTTEAIVKKKSQHIPLFDARDLSVESKEDLIELPMFDLDTIATATENFSSFNLLGQGGFGSVYKGTLADGQQIAVKRLSKSSGQGVDEFMTEVLLIAKLQHRNLVRLLGCCVEGGEKMLLYELMQNKSLDSILFNQNIGSSLDWQTRFNIIAGIARGLLYLHQDSILRIIHRDLKPSNILLDGEMNPKISDFGMARIFGGDETEGNTLRVVGTYGYMSPEYAMEGLFSIKSDVFSFGVLVLEIVSGKKNRGSQFSDNQTNLLGYAWSLWREARGMELIDPSIRDSCSLGEAMRCIQVGLLCVQERAEDRPTMSTVVLMLSSEALTLPQPKFPGFGLGSNSITEDSGISPGSSSKKQESSTVNSMSVTELDPR